MPIADNIDHVANFTFDRADSRDDKDSCMHDGDRRWVVFQVACRSNVSNDQGCAATPLEHERSTARL